MEGMTSQTPLNAPWQQTLRLYAEDGKGLAVNTHSGVSFPVIKL